ncbi:DMT family transporter [Acinetobacter larvae]|uniref:EamA family transporter n=1 Tax=Acinetobacter larvae TaxID=1789224 RepID=A0A1B2LY27_9GAMM|nr:DMT family transporter [Acinetobacter larvae]AOA57841.1 EamA family transporter [Acinetobacter larvae]
MSSTASTSNIVLTYMLLVVIWSTTPLAIVWSVTDLHIMWALLLRFVLALLLSGSLLLLFRINLPCNRQALHSYLAGAFSLIGSQIFTYAATQYLSSGILALMFGLAPIMAGLIGHFAFSQRLHAVQWLGMCVAVSGLAVICLSAGTGQHVQLTGIILMLFSVFFYSLSIFWVKKVNAQLDVMAQATGSILVSTLLALLLLPFIWQYAPTQLPSLKTMLSLIYTVVMASMLAMYCYFKLVKNIQATTLSLTTVMTPLLALLLGALLNNEIPNAWVLLGAVLLLSGLLIYFMRMFGARV